MSAMLPTPEQTWLLRACLLEGEDGRTAWAAWRDLPGDAKAAMAEDRWSVKRLLPALYSALRRNGAAVDAALLPYLKLAYVREQIRSRTYVGICHEVLTALDEANIPTILLRGAALAMTVYPDPALRHCHDIALLVQSGDVVRAADALQRKGLEWLPPSFTPAGMVAPGAVLRHETTLPVELHTALFGVALYACRWPEIWPRTQLVHIAGTDTRVLSPADALLHVCGHASYSESRESLRWVGDAWHIIATHPDLDWELLCETAQRTRLTLPLAVTLGYLSVQLGAPIPERVLHQLEAQARRVPPVERDLALRGVRAGAHDRLGVMLHRVPASWHVRARIVAWLLWPSREYVRDVVGVRGRTATVVHYLRRPLDYARRLARRAGYAG